MSVHEGSEERLSALLTDLFEDSLRPEAEHELEALVSGDHVLRQVYVRYLFLHARLHEKLAKPLPPSSFLPKSGTPGARLVRTAWLASTVQSLLRPVVASMVAVAVIFYGLFALLSMNLRPAVPSLRGGDVVASSADYVATIKEMSDVRWSKKAPKFVDKHLRKDASLQIEQGLMKIQTTKGVYLVVQGPADWTMNGDMGISLRKGKLVVRVPKQAIGYTVSTPDARIVDLGTEFGVEVDFRGDTNVQVYKGLVEFTPIASTGAASGKARLAVRRLQAGEAAQVGAQRTIVSTEFVPDRFARGIVPRVQAASRLKRINLKTASATQSSEFAEGGTYPAQAAIDRDPATFSHTLVGDSESWWQVDLIHERPISFVVLQNEPSRRGWLRDITIRVLDQDGKTVIASSRKLNSKNSLGGGEQNFDDGPAQVVFDVLRTRGEAALGRFVRVEREACAVAEADMKTIDRREIWLRGCKNTLVLGEVQIYELPAETAAEIRKPEP